MLSYNKREIEVLISMLKEANTGVTWQIEDRGSATFFGVTRTDLKDIMSINDRALTLFDYGNAHEHWRKLITFIWECPLEDVPLYVNKYPQLVRWRMSISK